jgi:L-amino acid N-acyltransferase YncA
MIAAIKKENLASLKIFQRYGFNIVNEDSEFYHLATY